MKLFFVTDRFVHYRAYCVSLVIEREKQRRRILTSYINLVLISYQTFNFVHVSTVTTSLPFPTYFLLQVVATFVLRRILLRTSLVIPNCNSVLCNRLLTEGLAFRWHLAARQLYFGATRIKFTVLFSSKSLKFNNH
jgi:hypothetical protein